MGGEVASERIYRVNGAEESRGDGGGRERRIGKLGVGSDGGDGGVGGLNGEGPTLLLLPSLKLTEFVLGWERGLGAHVVRSGGRQGDAGTATARRE